MKFLLVALMYVVLFAFIGVGVYLGILVEKNEYDDEKISDMDIEDIVRGALMGGFIGLAILFVLSLIGYLFFCIATAIVG